jgi:NAD(P)-dependent dehydrogenase (short-subunit alcohol dehydrogenase family)
MSVGQNAVLVTGARGGIGAALCRGFKAAGWFVIGTSQGTPSDPALYDHYVKLDMSAFVKDADARAAFIDTVKDMCGNIPLKALINNAAVQHLGQTETITSEVMQESFNVNTIGPFLLTQGFLQALEASKGSVLNIGSVHARATKPEFVPYATTKAALHGLTRALAVDLGGRVRVNTLAPAATATPMLLAGFEGREEAFKELAAVHPVDRIAQPEEICDAALFLCSDNASFVTGSSFYIDGGILSRLHDPV